MQYTALMLHDHETDAEFSLLVGGRLKAARSKAELTLDALAETSGVSRRTIVGIEQGSTGVSIKVMLRIANALGVSLASLLAEPSSDPLGVVRASTHSPSWVGTQGGQAILVASTEFPEIFELWDWILEPKDRYLSEAHSEGTHELIHVISGSLTLTVQGNSEVLGPGDSASYQGNQTHAYSNDSESPARFSLAVLQPQIRRKINGR